MVEVDGRGSHDTHIAFAEDRARDRFLTAAGYRVLRFTYADVTRRADGVAADLRRALRS